MAILLQEIYGERPWGSCVIGPMMPHPSAVRMAYGSLFPPGTTSFGLIALGQFKPISRPTAKSASYGWILFAILWRWSHSAADSGLGISSLLEAISSLVNALWSLIWNSLSIDWRIDHQPSGLGLLRCRAWCSAVVVSSHHQLEALSRCLLWWRSRCWRGPARCIPWPRDLGCFCGEGIQVQSSCL